MGTQHYQHYLKLSREQFTGTIEYSLSCSSYEYLQTNLADFILHFLKGERCFTSLTQTSMNSHVFLEGQL